MIKRILLRTGHYRICKGRKIQDDDKIISVAKITAKEYYMEKYNDKKLVRDNISAIIESVGRIPIYKCIEDRGEYEQLLKCKLQEEIAEFLESNEVVELCDVVEVVYALIKVQGMSLEDFERLRLEKASINGIFEKRFFLNEIIDQAC